MTRPAAAGNAKAPTADPRLIPTPFQALAKYKDELNMQLADGRLVVLPGVIGTVFFERGSKPDVRQGILDCFDRFEVLFGKYLQGGKDADLGKFTKRTPKGVENIRKAIIETAPYEEVSVVRSSATDQDTAAEYEIQTLTNREMRDDYILPGSGYVMRKGADHGNLSYIKFKIPLDHITDDEGLAQYEDFLRFVCQRLPVRGGYGGLSSILPYSFHRFMPQEYALAERFSGLEIDSYAFTEKDQYLARSYDGESPDLSTDFHPYLRPGSKVQEYGFIKSVNWYTLLGDVFVDRLGGEAAVPSALDREDIAIERVGQCLLIRAGEFPRLGAPEEGLPEPYVFVNSVLRVLRNPKPDSLHSYMPDVPHADKKASRQWRARFDLPGAPPIPTPPEVVPQPGERSVTSAKREAPVPGGEPCPEAGWWFTFAQSGSRRYFEKGEVMPIIDGNSFGATYWQRISDQDKS
jgi:hypothetical protein